MEIASLGNAESLRVTITHELEPCDTRGEVESGARSVLFRGVCTAHVSSISHHCLLSLEQLLHRISKLHEIPTVKKVQFVLGF